LIKISVNNDTRNLYEKYYENIDSEWSRLSALGKADNIIQLCSDLPHEAVLEIGAGDGAVLARLSELNFSENLCALDISLSGIEAIRKRKILQIIECKVFDGYHVPYENNRFDLVILTHVLEHVEHPRLLLYEASRIARYVFVEIPTEDTLRLGNEFMENRVGHINFYSPRTIRLLVQTCGLKVLNQIVTNPPKATYLYEKGAKGLIYYYVKQFLIKFFPGFAASLFAYHTALIAAKKF
jgi:ubiquinone/menaquinone biosynthesis C-methylase UbiE